MSAITATTDRRTILAELATARAENELWRRRLGTQQLKRAERTARDKAATARRKAATRRRNAAKAAQGLITADLAIAWRNTPTDPDAELHRHILIQALKETA